MAVDASLVEALRSARREVRPLARMDAAWRLESEEEAYETMFAVSSALGWRQAGWKIAATNERMQAQLRTDSPVFGPTFHEHFLSAPAALPQRRLLSPIVECEFFFVMGRALPSRGRPYAFDDVMAAIERVHVGIEIAECRYPEDRLPSKEFIIADGFASGWYVVGRQVDAWREAFARDIEVALYKNGKPKARGRASDVMGHPVAPIVWLANKLNGMGREIARGQIVSSGSCNILARARQGDAFKAVYGGLAEIDLEIL